MILFSPLAVLAAEDIDTDMENTGLEVHTDTDDRESYDLGFESVLSADLHEDELLASLGNSSVLEPFSDTRFGLMSIKTADSFAELQTELASAALNDGDIIQITADFYFTGTLAVTKSVIIESATGIHTLTRDPGFTKSMLEVKGGKTLTLRNITLDGNKWSVTCEAALVSVLDGGLTIGAGATLQNNNNKDDIDDNNTSYAGGVYIDDGFCEVLAGGTITGNDATAASGFGGGIYLYRGEVRIDGGTISNNTAQRGGGIYVGFQGEAARFVMTDGTISGNSVAIHGGGVYMNELSTALHTGGTITGNKADSNGAGIFVNKSVYDLQSNAQITLNISNAHGGGIYVASAGRLTVTDSAEISSNSAANGAGVFIHGSACYLRSNSQITLNISGTNGGGIYVADGGNLTVSDSAEIFSNAASYGGGGVYVNDTGQFAMDGGVINENRARFGGGVFVNINSAGSKFAFSAGVISENAAAAASGISKGGGGVHVENGSFDMSGGVITGNTAPDQTGSGLNLKNGTVTLSDTVQIGTQPLDNGVYLGSGKTLTIAAGGLSSGSHVNIEKMGATAVTGLAVAVKSSGTISSTEAEYFLYQPGGFVVRERPLSNDTYELYAFPTLVVHPSVLDFGSRQEGSTSAEQLVTVVGTNLTNDILFNLPPGFTVTKDTGWDDRIGGTLKIVFAPTLVANYNEILTVSSIGAVDQTVALTGIGVAAPPVTYTLTMVNGTDNTAAGTYTQGEVVSITADAAPNGQVFDYWSSSGGGSFADADSAATTFTMPAANVTVTANYKIVPSNVYTVTYAMGGASGGNVPTDGNIYTNGSTVTVQGNTGNLTLTGHRFSGWKSNANNQVYAAGQTFTIIANVTLAAQWKPISGGAYLDDSFPQTGNNRDIGSNTPLFLTGNKSADDSFNPDNSMPQTESVPVQDSDPNSTLPLTENKSIDDSSISETSAPQTGDNSSLSLWTTMLIFSLSLLCGLAIWQKYIAAK